MKMWKRYCMGLALAAGLATRLQAQLAPPIPPAAAGAVTPPAAAAPIATPGAAPAAAPPAAGGNLWSFLCPSPAQKEACKLCFCNSIVGKMVTSMMGPLSTFSGGMFQSRCPAAQALANMNLPPDSAQGAAARIQMDEMNAKARRAAVRYLGTVDCRYWPEAEEGLINSLRADRNECVRLEAAWALGRGCCCTRKTLEALSLTVSGSERDGNPIERSDRVKAAAMAALNNCLACLTDTAVDIGPPAEEPIAPPIKEGPGEKLPPPLPGNFYKRVQQLPMKKVVEDARRALAQARPAPQVAMAARPSNNGLVDIVTRAFYPQQPVSANTPEPVTPAVAQVAQPVQVKVITAQPAPIVRPAALMQPVQTMHAPPVKQAAAQVSVPSAPAVAAPSAPAEVQQHLALLRYGTPYERQHAAEDLVTSPWAGHPAVKQALTAGGRDDPEPRVRATCLRCLAQINFNQMAH